MKQVFLFLIILLVAVVSLFRPSPKGKWAGEYIKINEVSGIFLNADSYNFCKEAKNINSLFDTASIRQDRPAYLILVNLVSKPTNYIINCIKKQTTISNYLDYEYLNQASNRIINNPEFEIKVKPVKNVITEYFNIYISFVLVNIIILFLTVSLFENLLSKFNINIWIKIILLSFILFNRVVKAYLLNVHMQLFILLAPVLFSYSMYIIVSSGYLLKHICLHSFLMGLMSLFYGSFIFYFPALFLVLFYEYYKSRQLTTKWPVFIFSFALCILPTVVWINVLINVTGRYYNYEVGRFREFVWISDTLKISATSFLTTFIKFAFAFIICFVKTAFIYLLFYLFLVSKAKRNHILIYKDNFQMSLYSILLTFSGCFLLLGFYQIRLTFTLVPVLLLLIAILWQELLNKNVVNKRSITAGLVLAFFNMVYVLFTNSYYQ